jgi:glycosyltransferase involved in cell wall biosynthesis
VIVFLRSSDIGIDAKLRRYARALRTAGFNHMAIFWDRDASVLGDDEIPSLRYKTRGGSAGKSSTAFRLIGLNLFVMRQLWQKRKSIGLVHAVDFDTAIPAWLFSKLTGKPFIYDIYDHYPDSRGVKDWLRLPFDWLEARIISAASLVILADECRIAQHGPIPERKRMVIENVPDAVQQPCAGQPGQDGSLRVGYLGTLEPRYRGIEDLFDAVRSMDNVTLHIAGAGALEPHVRAWAAEMPNVEFHGAMPHEKGLDLLASCDVIAGLYYQDVPNHRYAAPNKYYEHLLLGKPLLTSLGTPPGQKVTTDDSGWAVEDGAEPIRAALVEALERPELLERKGQNAAQIWQQRYASYYAQAIEGTYVRAVKHVRHMDVDEMPDLLPKAGK